MMFYSIVTHSNGVYRVSGARGRRPFKGLQQQEPRDQRVVDGRQQAGRAPRPLSVAATAQAQEPRGQTEPGQARAQVVQPTGPEEPAGDAAAARRTDADVEVRVPDAGGRPSSAVVPGQAAGSGDQDQDGAAHPAHPAKVGRRLISGFVRTWAAIAAVIAYRFRRRFGAPRAHRYFTPICDLKHKRIIIKKDLIFNGRRRNFVNYNIIFYCFPKTSFVFAYSVIITIICIITIIIVIIRSRYASKDRHLNL